jgi:hypothetical protein
MSRRTDSLERIANATPGVAAPSLFSYYSWFWFSRGVRPRA